MEVVAVYNYKIHDNIQSSLHIRDFLWCCILKLEDEFSPTKGELMGIQNGELVFVEEG